MYKIFLSHITNCHPLAMAFANHHHHHRRQGTFTCECFVLKHKTMKYSFVRRVCKKGMRYAVLTSSLNRRSSYIYSQSSIFHQQIAKITVRFTRKETDEKKNRQTFTYTHILRVCM